MRQLPTPPDLRSTRAKRGQALTSSCPSAAPFRQSWRCCAEAGGRASGGAAASAVVGADAVVGASVGVGEGEGASEDESMSVVAEAEAEA